MKNIKFRYFSFYVVITLFVFCTQKENSSDTYSVFKDYLKKEEVNFDSIYLLLNKFPDDSLKNEFVFDVSYRFLRAKDSLNFRKWNFLNRELSLRTKDTGRLAESYWDLAAFFFDKQIDSSYQYYSNAHRLYISNNNNFYAGRMLLNMSILQKDIKDYVGSEISVMKALSLFKDDENPKQIYIAYNNLGVVFNELQNYDLSILYHNKAIEYGRLENKPEKIAASLNNIGVVYKNMKQYSKASEIFSRALNYDSLRYKDLELYAMLIDNNAHARLKNGYYKNLEYPFLEALDIRDSIDHQAGVIMSKIHLAEYYAYTNDTAKALNYALDANKQSYKTDNYRDLLESYKILANLKPQNSVEYFNSYVRITDSLITEERKTRNKFYRIQYETEETEEENKSLEVQRQWLIISSAILLIGILIAIILAQKTKNKKLILEKNQQEAQQEIYKLLLSQEQKLKEGKYQEKNRISKELHDGILSKLFGIRLNLSTFNNDSEASNINERVKYLKQLHDVENEIRKVSHELSSIGEVDDISFEKIIENYISQQQSVTPMHINLRIDESIGWTEIGNIKKINLLRILQEAVFNALKYSKANILGVEINVRENLLILDIIDDGVGFNSNSKVSGIGLKNIRQRVENVGGSLDIKSKVNSGTKIIVYIPLN